MGRAARLQRISRPGSKVGAMHRLLSERRPSRIRIVSGVEDILSEPDSIQLQYRWHLARRGPDHSGPHPYSYIPAPAIFNQETLSGFLCDLRTWAKKAAGTTYVSTPMAVSSGTYLSNPFTEIPRGKCLRYLYVVDTSPLGSHVAVSLARRPANRLGELFNLQITCTVQLKAGYIVVYECGFDEEVATSQSNSCVAPRCDLLVGVLW